MLIAGPDAFDNPGSKMKKAQSLGLEIKDQAWLQATLEKHGLSLNKDNYEVEEI